MTDHEQMANFTNKYQINVISSSKRAVTRSHYATFHQCSSSPTVSDFSSEPLFVVEIPLSKLDALARIDRIFYETSMFGGETRRVFEQIMSQVEEEKRLRRNNLALKEAYDTYLTLLKICGHKETVRL